MANSDSNEPLHDLMHVDSSIAPLWLALGRFAATFAIAESQLSFLLCRLSNLPMSKAQALLGGFRIDQAKDMIKRLIELEKLPKEEEKIVLECLNYLSEITIIRNNLFHYGPVGDVNGGVYATNFLKAYTPERVARHEITPEILHRISWDLSRISILLFFVGPGAAPRNELFETSIERPWLYKPGPPSRPYPKAGDAKTD